MKKRTRQLDYRRGLLFVKFVGTHRQYDQIDAATVSTTAMP
ncbi:MAG: type II toxin-antitoxin system HigB family toxin [Planctomycetes bacterium]|nr:type II toxin-antitoxin system HigB family toxin [Planctomycetota bacterium]